MDRSLHACDDFHRTGDAVRRRMLDGGLTRRNLIGLGIGGGLSIYAAQSMSLTRLLDGAAEAQAAAPEAPVLVSIFLPGGADLLDTLIPLNQGGAYRDARGANAVALPSKLKGSDLGIHPSLTKGHRGGIKGLFDTGKIGFLPGIDYANPNLSHFDSRHFWETGLITPSAATGWLGRYLDIAGGLENPLQGVSIGYWLSPVLSSHAAPVAALHTPAGAELPTFGVTGAERTRALSALAELANQTRKRSGPRSVGRGTRWAYELAERLRPYRDPAAEDGAAQPEDVIGGLLGGDTGGPVAYPANSSTATHLKTLASLIDAPLGIRVATVNVDTDFDTHAGQSARLTTGLQTVSEALSAFQGDLEQRGLADRVVTLVWTEFGRRVRANASGGTDHGAGGVGWLMGTRVNGGVLTEYPNLSDLDRFKNLKVTVDFRQVYASVLEQWLAVDANAVIPQAGSMARIKVIR